MVDGRTRGRLHLPLFGRHNLSNALAVCALGPDGEIVDSCDAVDFDLDGDVDLYDVAAFQAGFGHSE